MEPTMRYFIFNCFGDMVGNPKGYRTFRGASRQEKIMYSALWDAYDRMKNVDPINRLVSKIKLMEAPC
jgi:hypothetical protein